MLGEGSQVRPLGGKFGHGVGFFPQVQGEFRLWDNSLADRILEEYVFTYANKSDACAVCNRWSWGGSPLDWALPLVQ
jgi:hypothetical protein